jgi:hypothetical protein
MVGLSVWFSDLQDLPFFLFFLIVLYIAAEWDTVPASILQATLDKGSTKCSIKLSITKPGVVANPLQPNTRWYLRRAVYKTSSGTAVRVSVLKYQIMFVFKIMNYLLLYI